MSATISNKLEKHNVRVQTEGNSRVLIIPPKASGYGSSVNGGELLLLAIATCFCNDIYREAGKRNIAISEVEITASAEFDNEEEPGKNFKYKVRVKAKASDEEIKDLIRHTDRIAEIHNTIRQGVPVDLEE
ncbi:MAG TPA: OsmC family protein [Bacteroidales bacterium]|nr:OsmC family protein [Bacteroidales bacterium]